ncbi:hypothetical protein ACV334_33095, partial [Pseudomonas aeruginosa]
PRSRTCVRVAGGMSRFRSSFYYPGGILISINLHTSWFAMISRLRCVSSREYSEPMVSWRYLIA